MYNVHIFSKQSKIVSEENKVFKTISFGSVFIAPEFHRKGLGKALNTHSIKVAKEMGYQAILTLGYPYHYETYGFLGGINYIISKKSSTDFELKGIPQVNVTWYDAVTFCNLLSIECGLKAYYTIDQNKDIVLCDNDSNGYRLPTDAEWQYACKAGSVGYRYGEIDEIAWYSKNSDGMIHEVGKKEPNLWGLYDMLGSSWEWQNFKTASELRTDENWIINRFLSL